MKGLIIKDLLCLKKSLKVLLIMAAVFIFMAFSSNDISFVSTYISLLLVITLFSTFTFDDFSKWNSYAVALPVTRKQIVMSKYLLLLLFSIIGFIISMLLYIPLMAFKPDAEGDLMTQLVTSFSVMVALIFIISIILPFIYKFGTEKARLMFLIVGFGPVALLYLLKAIGVPKPNEEMVLSLMKISPVLVLMIFIISYFISLKIFTSKDL